MRIAVVGPLEVRTDDARTVPVPGAKERLLLAVLAAGAPSVVSTDRIVDCLWSGEPPPTARKSLQAHVVRLRSALEPDRPKGSSGRYVVRRGAGYALAVARTDLDCLELGDLAARGRARLSAGDVAGAEQHLAAATALWRGEPYCDWPEAPFAEAERRRLGDVRSAALGGLLEARLATDRHAEVLPELRRLVAEEPLHEEWWRLLMLALYRAGRQADALTAGRQLRALLAEELGAEPGPAVRAMEAAILAQDTALDPSPGTAVLDPPAHRLPAGSCPYKGLAAYQAADAELFHGRGRLVSGLVARLVDTSLLVISGPSGAGKSSSVRAGLVPALREGAIRGSGQWQPLIVDVGPHPVDLLAELTGETPPETPVLLVCDQFEQLWAPGVDPAERAAFLDALLGLLDDGVVVRCIAVVRGDHVGRLAEHAAFTERLGGAIVLVPPMSDPELRAIVVEPAGAVGLTVEPELVDEVVDDVLGRAGALPLLSTALVGTWERRRGDRLTLAGYLDAGGVGGALTRAAEEAYASLPLEQRHLARALLVRLADTQEGGGFVRRTVPTAEIEGIGRDPAVGHAVVEAFVARRLVNVDADRVEVAHEALFTAWPRLAAWLAEDAAGRTVRRHLEPAAQEWAARGRPVDELYRGARLAAALDWAAAPDTHPTALEREFLGVSRERSDSELREAHDQVARERRARRRTRRLATGLAAVMVLALVAALLAVRFQRAADTRATEAERIARVADADRLAAIAGTAGSLDLSLLLAAQAVRLADTPESEDGLLDSLLSHQRALGVVTADGPVRDSALTGVGTLFLDDGRSLSEWSIGGAPDVRQGPVRVGTWGGWSVADGSPVQDLLAAAGTDVYDHLWLRLLTPAGNTVPLVERADLGERPIGISFTGDGGQVLLFLVSDVEGEPRTWRVVEFDVAGGGPRNTTIGGVLPAAAGDPVADVSDDGRTAVVYDRSDGSVPAVLVDLTDGHQTPLQAPQRGPIGSEFRALGSAAVQLWSDGAVIRYGADGRPVQQVAMSRGPVLDAVLAPDGSWAATVGGGLVTIWAVDAVTGLWASRGSLAGHAGDVRNAEVTSDGQRLVTVGADDRIVVWDATPEGGFGEPVPADGRTWLAGRPRSVEPGGLVVVPTRPVGRSVADEETDPATAEVEAAFLDPRTGRVVERVPVGAIPADRLLDAPSLDVSPDGHRIAITTGPVTTLLDARTRRPVGSPIVLPGNGVVDGNGDPSAGFISCLAWTPDSTGLVLCAPGHGITGDPVALVLTDASTGAERRRLEFQGPLETLSPSPDRHWLVATSLQASNLEYGGVRTFDVRTLYSDRSVLLGDPDRATDVSFSPDGRWIAVTGRSGDVYLIDAAFSGFLRERIVSGAALLQAEWLDNRTVALAAADGTVTLFDAARGQPRGPAIPATGDGVPAHVHLMPVTSDELVAVSGERPGRRWSLDPMDWVRRACAVAGRDLTRPEWDRYLPDRPYRPTCTDLGGAQHG